jgi:aspartate/tyrosine/aromatic aminotransferase
MSQLQVVARAMYSSPPLYGARLVQLVLGEARLRPLWEDDLRTMSCRITEMRGLLVDALKDAGSDRDWSHINKQIGMFCYTGMSKEECVAMTEKHHVYMTENGRISMAGVNRENVDALAKAIVDVTTKK